MGNGLALRFDGFTNWLLRPEGSPIAPGSFTVAAWVPPGARPWNLAPILDMAPREAKDVPLLLDSTGRAVFAVALDSGAFRLRTPNPLPLTAWSHPVRTSG